MKNVCFLFCFVIANCVRNSQQIENINIGALFYDDEFEIEESFGKTIQLINSQNEVNFKLVPLIEKLFQTDGPLVLEKKACDLISNGVVAIFGPSSKADSDTVSLICNATGIPHMLFDYLNEQNDMMRTNHQMTLNVYPSQPVLTKAYADIVHNFGWNKFTVIYDREDDSATSRLQDILQLKNIHENVVRVRKFKKGEDYRILWKNIAGEKRVIIDCPPDTLVELLNASIAFNITLQFNHIFLTNLDTQTVNIDDLKADIAANVTAARLGLREVQNKKDMAVTEELPLESNNWNDIDVPTVKLLPDLIHDAVVLFYLALKNISVIYQITPPGTQYNYQDDNDEQPWPMGLYINRVMRQIASSDDSHFHLSFMQFDDVGQRINFTIEIYEPLSEDLNMLATWDTQGQISQKHVEAKNTKKHTYKVSTRVGEPYFMKKADAEDRVGNDRYMGYAVDLLAEIQTEFAFDYVFEPVADNNYGSWNKDTNQWDGIVAELINGDAHMGICDLTITQKRKTVVDFTVPFMQLGISILGYQKPLEQKPWSNFLEPFTNEVWIYVMVSVFIIAFLFIFMGRISTSEWLNPHPCNKDPDALENTWDISNSFWLTIGSIMTAGSDVLPRSAPMRTFNAMWWIFAVIIANSYTANLAAFLTNSKMEGSIKGVEDLSKQSEVTFGTNAGGSTYTYFAESNETKFRLAFGLMNSAEPSVYTKNNDEGVNRVLRHNGSYMFLMETTTLEYNTERNCRLRKVGDTFGEKHYAIAVPIGADYRSNLSVAILKLGETGKLFELKSRWWLKENNSCPQELKSNSETNDLNLSAVRGMFYTLYVGLLIAYLVGITEFLIYTQHVAVEERLTFNEAFVKEIKFVLKFWNNKKPVTPPSSTRSSSYMSTVTDKSGKSSKTHKSTSGKIKTTEELQERKSTKSLKSAIINHLREHNI